MNLGGAEANGHIRNNWRAKYRPVRAPWSIRALDCRRHRLFCPDRPRQSRDIQGSNQQEYPVW